MKEGCGTMNMPAVLSKASFIEINNRWEDAATKTFRSISLQSREMIKAAYADDGMKEDKGGILDIALPYDGAWQRHGHVSHNSAASTIDLLAGLPIDIEVLSNYCSKCTTTPEEIKMEAWKNNHAANCLKNFNGTAGAMQVEAAKNLWERSVEQHKLRSTTMLCDGDSKAFGAVNEFKVYGDDAEIEKQDCINHVSKRMGSALRNVVAVYKAQKKSISGKGKLSQIKVKKIQNCYGKVIKYHAEDTKLCQPRIMAIFHLSSTDTNPKHVHCPPGESSWCFWYRANAKGEEPGPHKAQWILPPVVGSRLVPIFQRLSDEKLIKRCARKKTPHPNESLHQIVWKICPKAIYVGQKIFA
eukprot:gene1972-biopygen1792